MTRGSKKTRTLFVIMLCVLVLCLFTTTPNKILPNLCKGVARSKGFLILLAYAREILGIIAQDLIYNYSEQNLSNLCKGVARSKGFLILLAYAHEIHGIIAEDFGLV